MVWYVRDHAESTQRGEHRQSLAVANGCGGGVLPKGAAVLPNLHRRGHAPQFVDQPGEWHLDRRTGTLLYQAAEGQDPRQQHFVAPKAERLLRIVGRPGAPVRNLRFVGLRFKHAAWHMPKETHVGIQAGYNRATPLPWPSS